MKRLLELEYIKLRYSRSTKVTSIIYMILTLPILLIAMSVLGWFPKDMMEIIDAPFSFPGVWLTGTWLSTCLIILPAILSILHVGGEFTQKIHRQHIIDGLSKNEYVISKFLSVFIISEAW